MMKEATPTISANTAKLEEPAKVSLKSAIFLLDGTMPKGEEYSEFEKFIGQFKSHGVDQNYEDYPLKGLEIVRQIGDLIRNQYPQLARSAPKYTHTKYKDGELFEKAVDKWVLENRERYGDPLVISKPQEQQISVPGSF